MLGEAAEVGFGDPGPNAWIGRGQGNADQVAQLTWRSEGSPVVLRGELKAGCLDEPCDALPSFA